jgi:hypothetical protein
MALPFQPRISIVVEAYNEEQNGLAPPVETVEALLSQDFPLDQAELILTGSQAQIQVWRGMRLGNEDPWPKFGAVRLVPVDPAESHYWQLKNKGAELAQAEWLAFIDCDGLPGPRWLRSMTDALESGADVSVGPSQYRTGRWGPDSPLMLAAALPTWSFALSPASRAGKPVAAALMAHNLGIRRDLLRRHPFPLLPRSFPSSLLFFELMRHGAKFSYQPEQRVAHGVTAGWWLTRAHFRRGWETYEGRAADPSWPRITALEKLVPLRTRRGNRPRAPSAAVSASRRGVGHGANGRNGGHVRVAILPARLRPSGQVLTALWQGHAAVAAPGVSTFFYASAKLWGRPAVVAPA